MRKALLDTDMLSELIRGHDRTVVWRGTGYARVHGVFTFTSVTTHEIVFGLKSKGAHSQVEQAVRLLRQNEEITPIAKDYFDAAGLRASARRLGLAVHFPDSLIASVAIRLGLRLVTGNTGDFEAIQRTGAPLMIENWRDAPSIQ